MRLSEIKQPFTILCRDNEMVHKVVDIVKEYFCAGRGQKKYGVYKSNTIINIAAEHYYSQDEDDAEDRLYTISEIDELKSLTNSNWYDTVHVMD